MNKEEVYSDLNEVFKDVFDDETITVNENTTADDIEMWDSFEHINWWKRFRSCYCERNSRTS